MKWKPCILLALVNSGDVTDALGNPVMTLDTVLETKARFTPWTVEEINLEGREVTRNEQRYLIPLPFDDVPVCEVLRLGGYDMDIIEVVDYSPRYTLLRVKAFKER